MREEGGVEAPEEDDYERHWENNEEDQKEAKDSLVEIATRASDGDGEGDQGVRASGTNGVGKGRWSYEEFFGSGQRGRGGVHKKGVEG